MLTFKGGTCSMPKTLLVTDDAKIIREMIRDHVSEEGWVVVAEATNGQEAIEKYQELRPDLVTLDMVMPEYDGLHALRGIMAIDPHASVLVVSALDQPAILTEAVRLGAGDFVGKPFAKDRLINALARLSQSKKTAVGAGN